MKSFKSSIGALAACLLAPAALAQSSSTTTAPATTSPAVAALNDQAAIVTAQAQLVAAQNTLVSNQAQLATSQAQAVTNAISQLNTAGNALPSGAYTASSSGVVTPLAAEMLLNDLTTQLSNKDTGIAIEVSDGKIILVSPGQELTNTQLLESFQYTVDGYLDLLESLNTAASNAQISVESPPDTTHYPQKLTPKGGYGFAPAVLAGVAALSDLPGLVKSVTGLFQTNTTESAYNPGFPATEAQTLAAGDLIGRKDRTVYLSLDAYFGPKIAKTFADFNPADSASNPRISDPNYQRKATTMSRLHALATAPVKIRQLVFLLDQYSQYLSNDSAIFTATLKAQTPNNPPAGQTVVTSGTASSNGNVATTPSAPPPPAQYLGLTPNQMLDRVNWDNFMNSRLSDIVSALNTLNTAITTYVGTLTTVPSGSAVPLLATIFYEDLSKSDDKAVQLELTLDNQFGSMIVQTGAFWTKRPVVSSMFGVEYRAIDFKGTIKAAGVIHGADLKKYPDLSTIHELAAK